MEKKKLQARRFALTIYDFEPLRILTECPAGIRFLIGQLESGKEEERLHFQAYVETHKPMRIKKLWKTLGVNKGNHAEQAKGSAEDNIEYCTKEDTRSDSVLFFSLRLGEQSKGQGARTDLKDFYAAIKRGASDLELLESETLRAPVVKYQKVLGWMRNTLAETRSTKPTVWFFWGPTGTGKSHAALELSKRLGGHVFWKMQGNKWFDGLRSDTKVMIWDEFAPADCGVAPSFILRLLEPTALTVEIKGGTMNFNVPFIIFTR